MKTKLIFIAIVFTFLTAPALADSYGTVDLKETYVSPQTTMTIYGPGVASSGVNAYTGVYHWDLQNATITTPNPFGMQGIGDIRTWGFCIEMQYAPTSFQQYNIIDVQDAPVTESPSGDVMGDTKADYIRELWAMVNPSPSMLNVNAAAFQVAVWEIVYEDADYESWDVDAWDNSNLTTYSSFKVAGDADVISTAQGWLDDLGIGTLDNSLVALSRGDTQDYIVKVPVPGAVLLGLLGFCVAGLKLRKLA
jgi:hypothetical protein